MACKGLLCNNTDINYFKDAETEYYVWGLTGAMNGATTMTGTDIHGTTSAIITTNAPAASRFVSLIFTKPLGPFVGVTFSTNGFDGDNVVVYFSTEPR